MELTNDFGFVVRLMGFDIQLNENSKGEVNSESFNTLVADVNYMDLYIEGIYPVIEDEGEDVELIDKSILHDNLLRNTFNVKLCPLSWTNEQATYNKLKSMFNFKYKYLYCKEYEGAYSSFIYPYAIASKDSNNKNRAIRIVITEINDNEPDGGFKEISLKMKPKYLGV